MAVTLNNNYPFYIADYSAKVVPPLPCLAAKARHKRLIAADGLLCSTCEYGPVRLQQLGFPRGDGAVAAPLSCRESQSCT